ncbi:hypothetical protein SAMN05216359_10791 [Roseateles sp. YR242]|uniref:hypothetical protein n=1 Tax=Roseateles sp. YR242 TaxID=1855305 RepID=UPI0008C31519|nr:hypothetical protein [Roseateles sp. YR242]SEL28778.1 hypothetical protein SAMN05216359_10791 [Roseateles sp. YR242]
MNTIRTNLSTATSFKAFAFGVVATMALTVGISHAEAQHERTATTVVKLDTVYITGKRVVAQAQTLPTVYITGRRAATAEDTQVAAAEAVSTTPQL